MIEGRFLPQGALGSIGVEGRAMSSTLNSKLQDKGLGVKGKSPGMSLTGSTILSTYDPPWRQVSARTASKSKELDSAMIQGRASGVRFRN